MKSYANRLPDNLLSLNEEKGKEKLEGQFTHSYFKDLVVEMRNLK